jgi:23S rRNA-/tRNA-specific pseudouridylate synthase
VSRLDQPVSGIVIFAKSPVAAASLAEQFRTRTVEKTYLALVEGRFPGRVGAWCHWQDQLPRLPHGGDRPRPHESPAEDKGQEAVTAVRLLERAAEVSLVELQPGTGRRHQLRRQLADRRCPIVGDRRYGSRIPLAEAAIALHALAVRFAHPEDQRPTLVRSQPPRLWFERFPVIQGLGTGM